ncbi:uncharacterized protein HMPREF1541_06999 [Cyphellophora europaea CBS 101466]|uniref:Ribosome biogenesis protein SLX9 n=1 Tax=Cyphellophora europaea (strain CBS 101466) TaxID=1220924 RepID=W2RR86_CYPE1|nr:uncharacterized protein HMPREF1541_06999 [Cyphellophora europaea CBS 101466]ETN38957.1 hypothetical protein HMPREF1541_06999 [Cyphellophora europaea CBS 101466]
MAPLPPSSNHRTAAPKKSILKSSGASASQVNPASSSKPSKTSSRDSSLFPTTKADKRRIKHSALLSKVTKPRLSTTESKQRRRRPNKKLVTTLDSLVDALPEPTSTSTTSEAGSKDHQAAGDTPEQQVNIIKRKSMKSKPGALKRKQRVENEERARWGRNMAQMSGTAASVDTTDGTKSRWAALRGFIGETLERRPDVTAAIKAG